MNTDTKRYKNNIILDFFHTFFRNTNFTQGIWAAFLLIRGFSLLDVGIFEMVFHISSLTMEVPTGVIGDIYGRRVSRLLGVTLYFVYIILMLVTTNYVLILIAFIFCGISYTFESGSGDALVYDSLKEIHQEQSFMKVSGIKEVIYQSATVLVLIATGLFLEGQHVLDYKLTILMYIFAFMMIFFMKETKIPHESKNLKFRERMNNHFIKTWKVVTSSKRLMFLIVMGTLLFAPVTSLFIWAQEYFLYNGFSEEWMLYFLAFHSLTAAIGGFLASKIEKKFGEKKLLLALPILFSTCFFLTLIPYYGFIGFIIIGFLDSLFYVVLFDYINRLIPSETRASVLSFFGMCFSIVMIITFPVMGLIGTLTNIWYAYLFISIVVLIVSLLMIKTILKNNISKTI